MGCFWKKAPTEIVKDMSIFQSNGDYLSIFWLQKKVKKKRAFRRLFYKKLPKKNKTIGCLKMLRVNKIPHIFVSSLRLRNRMSLIHKQTKNRNETGSNLSLGTRLTVLSKCLGRKRCCDATPDRCPGEVPSHDLRFAL